MLIMMRSCKVTCNDFYNDHYKLLQAKEPACVSLLGPITDIHSSSLAQRLGMQKYMYVFHKQRNRMLS